MHGVGRVNQENVNCSLEALLSKINYLLDTNEPYKKIRQIQTKLKV